MFNLIAVSAIMVPPSRPNVTRLSDDKVMVRWSVSPRESLPIQFFKVQYRLIGNTHDKKRSQWMTANDDIPPTVFMYEVDNLKSNNYYRFRIAAVYSNNDNTLSNVSKNFLLLRGSQIPLSEGHLPAPNLTSVEPISENSVVLHWVLPEHNQTPFDGFYAHYRPASTAGEYSKATVDGMDRRSFRIDNLEPGTAYEFKLQSYTSSAASDFMAIITGKTLSKSYILVMLTKVNCLLNLCFVLFQNRQLHHQLIQVLIKVMVNPKRLDHMFSSLLEQLELVQFWCLHSFCFASL